MEWVSGFSENTVKTRRFPRGFCPEKVRWDAWSCGVWMVFDGFHDNRNAPGKIFGISYKILLTKNTSDAILKVEHLHNFF